MRPLRDMLKERCHRLMFVLGHVTKTQREEPAVSFCLGSSVNDAADGWCGVALWIVVLMEFIQSDDAHRNGRTCCLQFSGHCFICLTHHIIPAS